MDVRHMDMHAMQTLARLKQNACKERIDFIQTRSC